MVAFFGEAPAGVFNNIPAKWKIQDLKCKQPEFSDCVGEFG
jgi:hypothetical protein